MKLNIRVYGTPSGKCWFGGQKRLIYPPVSRSKLFAFVVMPSGETAVMEYEDTPDGCEDLASLLRTGDVVRVVRGEALEYSIESVVSVARRGTAYESRLPITRSV
jgi:hypothetical protein